MDYGKAKAEAINRAFATGRMVIGKHDEQQGGFVLDGPDYEGERLPVVEPPLAESVEEAYKRLYDFAVGVRTVVEQEAKCVLCGGETADPPHGHELSCPMDGLFLLASEGKGLKIIEVVPTDPERW